MAIPNHADLLQPLADKVGAPSNNDDTTRRVFTQQFAEQLAFSFPAEGWGCVRNANGNQSSDKIVQRGQTRGIDLMTGHPPSPQVEWRWDETDVTGTSFIEVTPHNYLAAPPPVEEPPEGIPCDLREVLAAIAELRAELAARTAPDYEGTIKIPYLGSAAVTLRPKR